MSIDYARHLAYGFPVGKNISYEDREDRLWEVFNEEGLDILDQGCALTGDTQSFIALKKSCIYLDESDIDSNPIRVDNIGYSLGLPYKNLIERAKEFGIPGCKIGWYLIQYVH